MCTIGAVLNDGLILFKNLDLTKKVNVFEPEIFSGKYRYIGYTRESRPGIWAGINESGLGIVAADAHTTKKYRAKPHMINKIFRAYNETIAECKDVEQAHEFLRNFYEQEISIADLVLIADRSRAVVLEYTPEEWGVEEVDSGFILRINHFRTLKGTLPKQEDPDSYLRYEIGEKLLTESSSLEDVMNLCRSHIDGPSVNSICRHGKPGDYKTIASAVMVASERILGCYIVNQFPCKAEYREVVLR